MSCYALFAAATALVEGKIGKSLKKVLKKVVAKEAHEQLAISDAKLGGIIKVSDKASRAPLVGGRWAVYVSRIDTFFFFFCQEKLDVTCVHSSAVAELMRCIRSQMESLITGLPPREMSAMSLGLAHR